MCQEAITAHYCSTGWVWSDVPGTRHLYHDTETNGSTFNYIISLRWFTVPTVRIADIMMITLQTMQQEQYFYTPCYWVYGKLTGEPVTSRRTRLLSSLKTVRTYLSKRDILTAELLATSAFWDVKQCHWAHSSQHFKGSHCLQFQGQTVQEENVILLWLLAPEDEGITILRIIRN